MPAKPKPAKKANKPAKPSATKAPAKPAKKATAPKSKAPAKSSPTKKPAPKAAKAVVKSPVKSKTAVKPSVKAKPPAKASSKGKAPTKKPESVKKTPPAKSTKKAAPAKAAPTAKKPTKDAKPAAKKEPAKKEATKKEAPKAAKTAESPKPAAKEAKAPKEAKKPAAPAMPYGKVSAAPPITPVSRNHTDDMGGATIDVPRVVKVTPFLKKQKQRLIELRSMLLDQMDSVAEGSLRVRPEGSEASAFGMHQADAGSDAYDRDFALSLLSQEQDSLYEINEALKRIDMGTYGICEMSGKPIPEIRLEALPFTRFTVECQAQIERQNMGGRFRRPVRSLFGLDEAADDSGDDADEETEPVDKNAD